MAAKRILDLIKSAGSCSSVRGFASASGYSRSTVALPPPMEDDDVPFQIVLKEYYGTDYKHWYVKVDKPHGSRDEIIARYVKIFTDFIGNEDEARKKIYSVSTRYYYAFCVHLSEEEAQRLKKMPQVLDVLPDSYVNRETKDYGGEPFIDGKPVPYDPKYHKFYTDFHARSKARIEAIDKEKAEAMASGEIETDEEEEYDNDDVGNSSEYAKRLKVIQEYYSNKK